MTLDRSRIAWDAWGNPDKAVAMSPARSAFLLDALRERFGRDLEVPAPRATLAEVSLPTSMLTDKALVRLREACAEGAVETSAVERVTHALGRSLPDLFRLRSGSIDRAPDAVVYPSDEEDVAAVLRIAVEERLSVVPFGGGSSVVGGVEAQRRAEQAGCISLDTTRMHRLLRVDAEAGLATFEAGIDGPGLEAALAEHGLTLGHYPQSFEYSTLGGWIATRSSGQQSNGYGGIEKLLAAVRMMTPEGVLRTIEVPRSAAGPDLNQLVLGSEGALGVIVQATLRVRPAPTAADDRGLLFHCFSDGVAAVRELVQADAGLGMLRLSDATETAVGQLQRHDPDRSVDPVGLVLSALERAGYGESRSLLLYGAEGTSAARVKAAVDRGRSAGRRHGGVALGRLPGKSWRKARFHAPYLRDWLLDHAVAVDTFETAFSWSRVEDGHRAVIQAMESAAQRQAGGGVAMAHLSHSYRDGACLYFTLIYPTAVGGELEQWRAIKCDVTQTIVDAGGTLSHHHGVGRDHAAWLSTEKGATGAAVLSAVKDELDPTGVMSPGVLL